MKNLLITLLLVSPLSFAEWGDVYYCQMTTLSKTTLEGERTDYKLEKFQFKLDETRRAMVFGNSGYLKDFVMEVPDGKHFPAQEFWWGYGEYGRSFFEKGRFLFSIVGVEDITSISANCDKF
jgi:hypothetical protein